MKFIPVNDETAFKIAQLRIYEGNFLKYLKWYSFSNKLHTIGKNSVAEEHLLKQSNLHQFKLAASAAMLSKLGKLFYL